MTIVRDPRGTLLLHDPLLLDEDTTQALDLLGEVAALFVPSALHDLDVETMRHRYPRAALVALPATHRTLARRIPRLQVVSPEHVPAGGTISPIPA